MTDTAIISAFSPIATSLFLAGLYWVKRAFIKRMDENRDVTLSAVDVLTAKLDIAIEKQALHEVADLALFLAHGERIAWLEGHTGKALGSMAKEDPQ